MLPVAKDRLSSLLKTHSDVDFGLARTSVGPWCTFWMIFILDLALSYADKLLVFRWVLIVLPLWLVCFCFAVGGGGFVASLSGVGRAGVVGAFESASRCLYDLLNIDNPCFEGVVGRVCPPELQLSRAGTSDTEAPFLDLRLSISDGFVSSGVYDKRDGFDFDIVGFPFLDGGVPRSASCGVCISQLVRFAGVSGHVVDFSAHSGGLTVRLLQRGCRCRGLRKTFSKFYRRHYELVSKFNVGLGALLHQGLSGTEFCGDLVCGFRGIVGGAGFSGRFGEVVVRYGRVGCGVGVVRLHALCLTQSRLITLLPSLIARRWVGRQTQ